MKEIWCLFSVECDYDQPPNNLIAWWSEKPIAVQIAECSDLTKYEAVELLNNEYLSYDIPLVVKYRLEKCEEGKPI